MASTNNPKIVQITAVAVPGERRTFVNVYGLDDRSFVWQWNAKDACWQPNKIKDTGRQARNDGPPEGF
jgi:hypothetical protein